MGEGEKQLGSNLDDLRQRVNELSDHDKNIEYTFDKTTDMAVEGNDEPGGGGSVRRKKPSISAIRTYKSDVAKTIKKQKTSVVGAIAAEVDKEENLEKFKTPQDRARPYIKYALMVTAGFLAILGVALILYFTLIYGRDSEVLSPEIFPSFIFTEKQEKIEISGTDKRSALRVLSDKKDLISLSLGEVELLHIVDEDTPVTATKFFTHIDARVSGAFLRALDDEMNLGVHVFDGNQPFLILKTNFYENSFAGMLQWEKYMNEDLAPLFGPVVKIERGTTTDTLFGNSFFTDKVFQNKDTRILKNLEETILMYSFIDEDTILITTNEDTFDEILTRITSNRI